MDNREVARRLGIVGGPNLNLDPLTPEEEAHCEAGLRLQEAAIDWADEHREALLEAARGGCVPADALLTALDAYWAAEEAVIAAENRNGGAPR